MKNEYAITVLEEEIERMEDSNYDDIRGILNERTAQCKQAISILKGEVIVSGKVENIINKGEMVDWGIYYIGGMGRREFEINLNTKLSELVGKHISISIHKGEV